MDNTEIEYLELHDMHTVMVDSKVPWCMKDAPTPTPQNMLILVNKINELAEKINELIIK